MAKATPQKSAKKAAPAKAAGKKAAPTKAAKKPAVKAAKKVVAKKAAPTKAAKKPPVKKAAPAKAPARAARKATPAKPAAKTAKKATPAKAAKKAAPAKAAKQAAPAKSAKKAAPAKAAPKPKAVAAKAVPAKAAPAKAAAKAAKAAPEKKAPKQPAGTVCPLSGIFVPKQAPNIAPKTLEKLKALLLEEKERHLKQAAELQAEAEELASDREQGDTQFDEESGEGDTISVERERDLLLSATARQAVEEIDAALERMRKGTYGLCVPAGRRLPVARLEAIPWAEYCVDCKQRVERRR